MAAVVEVAGLYKSFRRLGTWGRPETRMMALEDVSFQLQAGEFAALVGESGSGKTTLGRVLMGLIPFERGSVQVLGQDVAHLRRGQRKQFRRRAQMVFQNPYASLDPAFRVRAALAEAVRIHRETLTREEVEREVDRLAALVRLPRALLDEFPTSLSGGERRRVGFGRALATRPEFVVTDEPVAGLDAPIQVQLLDLMQRVHAQGTITLLLISHDMRVVRTLASRILVLFRGRIVENAPARVFFSGQALHPYSQALLVSAFDAATCKGSGGASGHLTGTNDGCPYRVRCPHPDIVDSGPCATMTPVLSPAGPEHWVACHRRGCA